MLAATVATAQHTFVARIVAGDTKQPLPGATGQLRTLNKGVAADASGVITLINIPTGEYELVVRFLGYREWERDLDFSRPNADTLTIELEPDAEELGEITVSTTRSSRTIGDIPTRIEVISAGELDEKTSMQPSSIRLLLTESTGIQTQQTSAASANATIRIQGLDGKYTQLLQDGFPLYSGFAAGLSIVQIPPLNLKRVEVVKGSASTLYGGGAIAGLINLITREPTDTPKLSLLANVAQVGTLDLSGFYAQKRGKFGLTVYASRNTQAQYDVNADGFSDLPQYQRYTFSPRFFYYANPATTVSFGVNASTENRVGGDMQVIGGQADNLHTYAERNRTGRVSTQFRFDKTLANRAVLTLKNSVGYFARVLTRPDGLTATPSVARPDYRFGGQQLASFSEISYLRPGAQFEWVMGGNVWTDQFRQDAPTNQAVGVAVPPVLDYSLTTVGAFGQANWKPTDRLVLEAGLRTDYISRGSVLVLPRASVLYKWSPAVTTRIGGGLGYKAPTPFTEEAEEQGFQGIGPVSQANTRTETSVGGNVDLNYRTRLFDDAIGLSFNQLFFYTRLNDPLVLRQPTSGGLYSFYSAAGYLDSKGFETNLKLTYGELAFYVGYTYTDARTHYDGLTLTNPLTARSRLYSTLMYDLEDKWRIGYEVFYLGRQTLRNGAVKPDYWIMGISVERKWERFSLFVNTENLLDVRQSRYEPTYTGSAQNPQFGDIWAPTDGFILNGGLKLNLLAR